MKEGMKEDEKVKKEVKNVGVRFGSKELREAQGKVKRMTAGRMESLR